MRIEGSAIDLIIGLGPALCRTPEGNPGFDLFEADSGGRQMRWVEVKSMTGTLKDRPRPLRSITGSVRIPYTLGVDFATDKNRPVWTHAAWMTPIVAPVGKFGIMAASDPEFR